MSSSQAAAADPVELSIWNHRLAELAEEMGTALQRAAFSPNIKERRDFSCALCDDAGRLVAQAAHIPVHLGSTGSAVRAVIEALALTDGEVAMVNDPFAGGTHLPDVTLVEAVELDGVRFHLAIRAHHADVGGAVPGSMAVARRGGDEVPERPGDVIAVGPRYRLAAASDDPGLTIDDEGIRVPPTRFDDELAARFAAATRSPAERRLDLAAQRAALGTGRRRLTALADRYGAKRVAARGAALCDYSARLMTTAIARLGDGVHAFADGLDDDGVGRQDLPIRVTITIRGGRAIVDFADSATASRGALNAVRAVTVSSVMYAFRLLCDEATPTNDGLLAPLEIVTEPGTIVDALPPCAVAAGNVETSQRIVDVVLGALAQALPGGMPAASAGSMSNLMIGSPPLAVPAFTYYETIAGGAGASPFGDGASALQTHMTNTWNTPLEVLEQALPLRIVGYALRRGSGGAGRHRGGDGVVRSFELLAPAVVTLIGERRRRPPYGLGGGGPGSCGADWLRRDGITTRLPSKVTFVGRVGDVVTVETPGGGGVGTPPRER